MTKETFGAFHSLCSEVC